MDREAFLERVRAAVATADGPDLPKAFPPTPSSGDGTADPERFVSAVAATNGMARLVERAGLSSAVADVARELRGDRRVVVAADVEPWRAEVDAGLADAGADVVRPAPGAWLEEAARAAMGVTSAALAVSATGSILLLPGADQPRVASLLPPVHMAVVPVEALVPGLEDVTAVLASMARSSSAPVLVTGPSRTSDIEMTTVYGVHGPKALRILLVE